MNHPLTMNGKTFTAPTRSTGRRSNVVKLDAVIAGSKSANCAVNDENGGKGGLTATVQVLLAELKRRRVFRAAGSYVVAAWLSAQVIDLLSDGFGAPEWLLQSFLVVAILGFPTYLMLAWVYDLTVSGSAVSGAPHRVRTRRARLDIAVIVTLAFVTGFLLLMQWQFSAPAIVTPQQLMPLS
ncbi:MAG: hypothetical protein HKN06_02520 [Gammaproteobacteria bacterium]|nr:hypothetical protein [Gammaproteobacteria bacterium]